MSVGEDKGGELERGELLWLGGGRCAEGGESVKRGSEVAFVVKI